MHGSKGYNGEGQGVVESKWVGGGGGQGVGVGLKGVGGW